MTIPEVFAKLPEYFQTGSIDKPVTIYFSLDDNKYTVKMTADSCVVEDGKTADDAVVLKTSGELFRKMVFENYMPGPKEFMTGKLKTNNPGGLMVLKKAFKFPNG